MKIIQYARYFLICLFTIILEMTVGKYLELSGTVPMLSFCLCLAISGREKKPNYIIFASIFLGVGMDLFCDHGFGTYTLLFVMSAYLTYILRNSIFSSITLFLILDTFLLSVLSCAVYYLLHILDVGINFGVMLTKIAFPTAFYNVIICVIFSFVLKVTLYKRR